ncbi:hypothetical protein P4S61_13940 [Pseudoalteromonas sp. B160]
MTEIKASPSSFLVVLIAALGLGLIVSVANLTPSACATARIVPKLRSSPYLKQQCFVL